MIRTIAELFKVGGETLTLFEAVDVRARAEAFKQAEETVRLTVCIRHAGRPPCQHERCTHLTRAADRIRELATKPKTQKE
jgi:hypothetical protein